MCVQCYLSEIHTVLFPNCSEVNDESINTAMKTSVHSSFNCIEISTSRATLHTDSLYRKFSLKTYFKSTIKGALRASRSTAYRFEQSCLCNSRQFLERLIKQQPLPSWVLLWENWWWHDTRAASKEHNRTMKTTMHAKGSRGESDNWFKYLKLLFVSV